MIWRLAVISICLVGCSAPPSQSPEPMENVTSPSPLLSGLEFLTPESQALQNDEFENPGFLWVERGKNIFETARGDSPSCASCHAQPSQSLRGAATKFPKIQGSTGTLINLEGQINLCRTIRQNQSEWPYETDALLAVTSYVASLSNGLPVTPQTDPENFSNLKNGETYFFTRRGQMNFSCSQCHDENWGKKLRGDTISQGHGNGFPAYRFEWEGVGSLHRRFADCDRGVRAEPLPLGSQTYVDLELYLSKRSDGLLIETPAIRR